MSPSAQPSYCRLCEGLCGVELAVEGGRITGLAGDVNHPLNAGYVCELGQASAGMGQHPDRLLRPLRRKNGELVPVSWDEALRELGGELSAIRKKRGARGIGVYAGPPVAHDPATAVKSVAFALAMGTPNLFTPLAQHGGPRLAATELVIGYPVPLQADVGRSHHVVLLGADQVEAGWGPLQAGTIHTQALRYFRKTRRSKLVAVDARPTALGAEADERVPLRPGTETFFLLGMANAILQGRWEESQYVRDYCDHVDRLRAWLEPWTPARVAEICQVDPGAISGVALKWSRAPMAVIAGSRLMTQHRHGTLAAWAWLVCHALTANLLRPGGLYDAKGLVDMQPLLGSFPSAQAPRTAVSGYPAMLLQSPATSLAEEVLHGGKDSVGALICVGGDPLAELPDRGRVAQALEALELLVVIDSFDGPTARKADWVLPATGPWERPDVEILKQPTLPYRFLQATTAIVDGPGEARHAAQILSDLTRAAEPPLLGGEWGGHLRMTGRWLAGADLASWTDRLLDFAGLPSIEALQAMPRGADEGELDRAQWRLGEDRDRLDLAPEALADEIAGLQPPVIDEAWPSALIAIPDAPGGWGSRFREPDADSDTVGLSPEWGFVEGDTVRVQSHHGEARLRVRLVPELRPDTVCVRWGVDGGAGELVGSEDRDPFTGTPNLVGAACRVEKG